MIEFVKRVIGRVYVTLSSVLFFVMDSRDANKSFEWQIYHKSLLQRISQAWVSLPGLIK